MLACWVELPLVRYLMLRGFSLMSRLLKTHCLFKALVYTVPFAVAYCLSLGRIFAHANGPIHATDLETPLNPTYYFWSILYPWNPLGLGGMMLPNIADMTYGFIATVSFGNELISQLLLLSLRPIIAYSGTLLLTRRTLGASIGGSVFASIFYAFSPTYLAWFPLPYQFSIAFIPWLFYVGFEATKHVFRTPPPSLRILITYALTLAIILSFITSLYFHILPLILLTLVISSAFFLKATTSGSLRRHIVRLVIFLSLVGTFYLLTTPRVFQIFTILTDPERQAIILRGEDVDQILALIKTFYRDATILNSLKLAGGMPINERFILLNGNIIGIFLPILVFAGMLFIRNRAVKLSFSKQAILLYVSCVVNSILLLTIAYIFRELASSNNALAANFAFSGMRRPERILETLTLFYALGMAFSVSVIEFTFIDALSKLQLTSRIEYEPIGIYSLTKVRGFLPSFSKRIARRNLITVTLLAILLLSYIAYSGLYVNPTHPAYSQLYAPKPKDFSAVEGFFQRSEIQASAYDATYRYMILPLYSPMTAYTRYNHPNFLYFSSFSSKEVAEFVTVTNELIAEQDTAAIFPLSLASIKYIAILPASFAQDELQAWRLQGKTRASGPHLFGDIEEYLTFISGLPNTQLLYESKMSVFVNERADPRIYVPCMLVQAQGDLKDVFKALRVSDSVFPLSNFALVVNQSGWTKSRSFVIKDFSRQMQIKATIFNLTELNFKYKSNEEARAIDEKSILVWSQQRTVYTEGNFITVKGTVPADQQTLSVWIRIPPTNLTGRPMLKTRLLVSNDMRDKIGFSILDQEGKPLPAEIEKIISLATDNNIYLDILIIPTSSEPTWLRVVLQGASGSTLEIALEKWTKFEEVIGLELYLNDTLGADVGQEDGATFPIVITNRKNMTVLWPVGAEGGVIEYAISAPIELDKALLLAMSTRKSDAGWLKVSEEVKWLSPVDISVNLEISPLGGEGGNEILVPLFFGNAYDTSWRLHAYTDSARITEIVHVLGNGFGNLWLVRISEIENTERSLHLSFKIQMDKLELYLYQIYALVGVTLLLLAAPLYILWVRRTKLPEGATIPDKRDEPRSPPISPCYL